MDINYPAPEVVLAAQRAASKEGCGDRARHYVPGPGDMVVAVKGRKVAPGTYGVLVAYGQARTYGFGTASQTSVLVLTPVGEVWVDSKNLQVLVAEVDPIVYSSLLVAAAINKADFITKGRVAKVMTQELVEDTVVWADGLRLTSITAVQSRLMLSSR